MEENKKYQDTNIVLEMKKIVKKFFDEIVNDNINLELKKGEVLALLGENGAGKSTLMKILYGLYSKDTGSIFINNKKVEINTPKDAVNLGIGMVHQHFTLVSDLTVTENIILGLKPEKGIALDLKLAKKSIEEFSKKYGIKVSPDKKIWQISVGERQRVEILKALYRNANILILDEPTAVLTPQEAEELFSSLKELKKEGKSVIFITHKLEEVMAISDRVMVLRAGKLVFEKETKNTNTKELAYAMVGREVLERLDRKQHEFGDIVLEVKDLKAKNDLGLFALKGVSFKVKEGEIFGLAGVSGNGQTELAEVLSGVRTSSSGDFYLKGKNMKNKTPRELFKEGVGRIPEDRMEDGSILDFPLKNNLILETYCFKPFSNGILLNEKEIETCANTLVADFSIKTHSIEIEARTLSGGNLQKAILARILSNNPGLIIASQPTRGLDVGATEYIHKRLLSERDKRKAVLLISEDLDEILSIADTIGVIYEGEILGIFKRENVDLKTLGLLMAGIKGGSS